MLVSWWHKQEAENQVLLAACLILFAILAWILVNPNEICCDCAVGLEWGQLLLGGATTYVDACDLDPPLWGYLDIVPAAVAAATHIPAILAFSLTIWLCCLLSKIAIWQVFGSANDTVSTRTWAAPVILVASIFDLATLNLQGVLMFGQREHMLVVFFLPFLILRWLRWNGGSRLGMGWSIIYGLLASMFLCLKHYFILLPAVLELYWILTKGKAWYHPKELLKPEITSAIVFAASYAGHFFLAPNIREQYLFCWIPVILQGYGYSSFPLDQMFWIGFYVKAYPELLLIASVLSIFLARRCTLLLPAALFAWAGYVIYMWQAKTWSYQAIPMIFGIYMAAALATLALCLQISKQANRGLLTIATTGGVALGLFALLHVEYLIWEARYQYKADPAVAELIKTKTNVGDPVLFLSTTPGDAYPLLMQIDRKPGCRYYYEYGVDMFAYMRQRSAPASALGRLAMTEKRFLSQIASDIRTRRPKLIFIPVNAQRRAHTSIVMSDYVKASPELSSVLQPYKPLGRVDDMLVFELVR